MAWHQILFRDITTRKQVEAELLDEEARLHLATTGARTGTVDFRVQTNELTWDDRCRELFGLPPGMPVSYGGSVLAGLYPEDRADAVAAVRRSMRPAGAGHFAAEYRTVGYRMA